MKTYIDLHIHSTASDGTFSPTEIVNDALKLAGDKNPDGRKNGSRCAGYNDPAATVGDWKSQTIFE